MAEKTMTLAEALSLKKSLERKINKRLEKLKLAYLPVSINDYAEHKEYYGEYVNDMKSIYQSLTTLKKNYNILCSAIASANAKTKTDMIDSNGNPYTISDLLSILSDSITNDMIKAMDDGYGRARAKQAGHPDIIIVDPFFDIRNILVENTENFKEKANMAIQKANAKKKIKVIFED